MTKSADLATLLDSNSKVPGADIASGSVTVGTISATGTPSASTFLRGDGSWNAPAGGVTSLAAGNGITVSGSTGAVTVSQDIYTGTTVANATYPIGSYVFVHDVASAGPYTVNSTLTIWSPGANAFRFGSASTGGSSVALTGTWRVRGNNSTSGDGQFLAQRTA